MYSPKLFLKDFAVGLPFLGSILAQIWQWWYVLAHISSTTEQVFLHYNIIFGVDLVGNMGGFYFPLILSLFIVLINSVLAWLIYGEQRVLARMLTIFTLLFQLMMVMGLYLIVGLNI